MIPINLDHIKLLVLVAGVSGAGKSVAVDTLSDLGFYTVENLPVPLFPSFIEFSRRSPSRFIHTALSLDIDSQEKQQLLRQILKDCSSSVAPNNPISARTAAREKTESEQGQTTSSGQVRLVFLDCKTDVIVKRYGQTRRPHPGFDPAQDQTLEDAILREKKRLFAVRELSNLVIDTSELNVHDLRREIRSFIETTKTSYDKAIRVNFLSFGFKHGVPIDCDLLVDARFLPNPYFIDSLREKNGKDKEVSDYVLGKPQTMEFVKRYVDILEFLLPHYIYDGKSYLNIGVGCTGGKHRSVVISEELSALFQKRNASQKCLVSVKHRDIDKPN